MITQITPLTIPLEFKKSMPGFKLLKIEALETLFPLSIIDTNNLKTVSVVTDIPIFFNVKNEEFTVFFADNFMKDYNSREIKSKNNKIKISIYKDKDGFEHLGFSYKNLNDLRNSFKEPNSHYSLFKEQYANHLLDIKNGELVIFLAFKNEPSQSCFDHELVNHKAFKDIIVGTSSKFEYFKAFKFNEKYYLLDKAGNIDQDTPFNLDKNSVQKMHYLVIPYTDKEWNLINKIHEKIIGIKMKIDTLFEEQKQIGQLDKSFVDNEHPLLNALGHTGTKKLQNLK